ncbi:helix-turn-helix transcriptional regulator [Paenibacillus melissococcoides]|uniref:helix-turn-helix transcriptional regulator n=1 Tax=Paenibacillus TaxID=44249 RepID=UPI001B11E53B|nr:MULTISPECIES: helix-turn-helix transcriptional regulator [Paenibacillus]MEB9893772.1 helix-turn-helix transcriptional regulator [Bacillus cereus]GIO79533.1 hypothetical protein J6TS7_31430 [Paenibacillus dendritiformis]CAH8718746.1 helix-turn-helix transcriptional regulator [Paenibacillus melissococcoides]CAH8719750.1 helix-turn-helix transcriptional regulator [Paenibacillus melissococcoides]
MSKVLLENIKSLCKQHQITIPKLEKEIELSKGSIYKWNTCSPSIDKVLKVSGYFRVPIEELTGHKAKEENRMLQRHLIRLMSKLKKLNSTQDRLYVCTEDGERLYIGHSGLSSYVRGELEREIELYKKLLREEAKPDEY